MFEEEGALDRFEGFASEHGANFYGLPLNEGTVTLEQVEQIAKILLAAHQLGGARSLPPEQLARLDELRRNRIAMKG